MKQYVFVEDYLFYLAGFKEERKHGTMVISWSYRYWEETKSPLSLATYDVGFINDVATQLGARTPLTDKQADLAVKIITKYRKQLASNGIDLPPQPYAYSLGLRVVDRSKSLTYKDGKLFVRFPFVPHVVASLKSLAQQERGTVLWDSTEKVWTASPTEFAVNWLVPLCQANDFSIDDAVLNYFNRIIEVEKDDNRIYLTVEGGKPVIRNAPRSLQQWLDEHKPDADLVTLVDYASVLGYEVDEDVLSAVSTEIGAEAVAFSATREQRIPSLLTALKLAKTTNRLPVLVYNPSIVDSEKDKLIIEEVFSKHALHFISAAEETVTIDISNGICVYYCNKGIPTIEGRLPLLISSMNLTYGKTRASLAAAAERIVYLCPSLS